MNPLFKHICNRCGHKWVPRTSRVPKNCPKCKSPYWNKPRVLKIPKMMKAVCILSILLLAVCMVPVVNADVGIRDVDVSKIRFVKNRLIDKLGIDKYLEIENDVSSIVDSYFIRFNITGYDLPLMDILKEIAVVIVAMMVLLFGNNPVGVGLGSLMCVVLLGLPVLLLAVVVTTYDLSQIGIEGLNLEQLIEDLGIIGTLFFCIILVPLLIIVLSCTLVVSVPIVWITMLQELVWYATGS